MPSLLTTNRLVHGASFSGYSNFPIATAWCSAKQGGWLSGNNRETQMAYRYEQDGTVVAPVFEFTRDPRLITCPECLRISNHEIDYV